MLAPAQVVAVLKAKDARIAKLEQLCAQHEDACTELRRALQQARVRSSCGA